MASWSSAVGVMVNVISFCCHLRTLLVLCLYARFFDTSVFCTGYMRLATAGLVVGGRLKGVSSVPFCKVARGLGCWVLVAGGGRASGRSS